MKPPALRRPLATGACLLALTVTAACGTPSSTQPKDDNAATATALAPAGTPTTSPTPADTATAAPTTDYVIHYAATDGTKTSATFSLQPMAHPEDPAVTSSFPGGAPCQADSQRDAVFTGTLTVTNDTPDFTAAIQIALVTAAQSSGGATLDFGAAYSTGARCTDVNGEYGGYGAMQPAISPIFGTGSTSWGPVNVEFVVHGVYSPSYPDGDRTVVSDNTPVLTAYEGPPMNGKQYDVDSVTGSATEIGIAGAVNLNLAALMAE